jgi:hypothetical protein
MTIPYKLNDEIKEFIVDKKKSAPSISCRQLVPLVLERFQLKLSKSSINAIIKANQLSSGIGRRRIYSKKARSESKPHLLPEPFPEPSLEQAAPPVALSPKAFPVPAQPAIAPEVPLEPIVVQEIAPTAESEPIVPQEIASSPSVSLNDQEIPPFADGLHDAAEASFPIFQGNITEPIDNKHSIEFIPPDNAFVYMRNCGCFLLRIADYKTAFISFLTTKISALQPDLSKEIIYFLLETLVYGAIFNEYNDLCIFLGKKMNLDNLTRGQQLLAKVDLSSFRSDLIRMGMDDYNINDISMLCKAILRRLTSLAQEFFFPTVYQLLDFSTMYSRFFCLAGKIERKEALLVIHFSYPSNFQWAGDIIWQEDFLNTTHKINQEKIVTPSGEKIWIDTTIGFRE